MSAATLSRARVLRAYICYRREGYAPLAAIAAVMAMIEDTAPVLEWDYMDQIVLDRFYARLYARRIFARSVYSPYWLGCTSSTRCYRSRGLRLGTS